MPRFFKPLGLKWHGYIVIFVALTVVACMRSDCSSNPCWYGICVDDPHSSYRCYCIDGYTGINCEINWDDCWSNPCLNGGTCNDAIASYNCTCPDGYVGLNCEQKYSECMNHPCLNNGTCLDQNGLTCQCMEGFSGEFCEIDESVCNNTICRNNGECFEGPGLTFACHCPDGWTGTVCEDDVNECTRSPCLNGGLCINEPGTYKCACLFGFTGKDCDKKVIPCDENPCQNNAVCLFEDQQPVCYCVPDYHGTFCELRYDDCESKYAHCHNGGSCVDGINNFTCSCPPRYTGETCDSLMPQTEAPTEMPTLIPDSRTTSEPSVSTSSYDVNTSGSTEIPGEAGIETTTMFFGEETETASTAPGSEQSTTIKATTAFGSEQPGSTSTSFSVEGRTEHEADVFSTSTTTTTKPDYTTTTKPDYTTTSIPGVTTEFREITSGATEETTFFLYTTDSVSQMYPIRTPSSEESRTTSSSGTVFLSNDSSSTTTTQASTIPFSTITSTIPPTTTTTTTPAIAGSTDSLLEVTLTTLTDSEVAWTTKPVSTTERPRPTDAEYDETMTSNLTAFVTERPTSTTPSTGTTRVVTMLPSTIVPSTTTESTTTDRRIASTAETTIPSDSMAGGSTVTDSTTMPTTTEVDSLIGTTITTARGDFTTVTEFHKSTFGTDMYTDGRETTSLPATTTTTTTTDQQTTVHSCTQDQCANTTLCIKNVTRMQCDCSYQNNCRKPTTSIENAAFNGKSYIRQKFTIQDGALSIFIRLKTKSKSGILIHALFDDERYVLLYIESGQLKFQFSCGLQTMLFGELDSPVNNGHEVDVEMRFKYLVEQISDRCSARLLVNGTVAMSGEQVLKTHESVPQFARLHLGGIPVAFSHQFPQIVLGFVGCMSLLKVNDVKRDFIRDSVEAVQIEECHSFLCLSNPCKNFGACEEANGKVKCKCFAGYSGETCERSICDDNPCHLGATCLITPGVNFICVCPLGTHGLLCEKETTILQPSFSVFAPGFSSYMAYGISASLKDNMELRLRIIPQTLEQISLIAYMGQSGIKRETSDHFSITFVRGYLMLTWDLGSGVRRIFTSTPLNVKSHKAHTIKVGRRGRDSWLYVEGIGNVTGRAAGTSTRLDVSPILYIGGHKSKYFETLPHDLPLHAGFSGCIHDIELRTDDNVFPITISSPATGRGVGECHRNECSHHSCKNGAVCLNYGPTYSCICMKEWGGPDCSTPVNCTSSSSLCHNNSK